AQLPALLAAGEAPPGELRVGPTGSARVRCRLSSPSEMAPRIASPAEAAAPATEDHGASAAPQAPGDGHAGRPALDVDERTLGGAAPAMQLRSPLSYTSISELERCGYRYYLERVLGLPEERAARPGATGDGGLEARSRGTLIHRLMESLDFARPRPPSPEDVSRCAGELGMRVGDGERVQIAGLIAAASTAGPAARLATAAMVRREHPFAFSLEGEEALITGVIDLLATEADGGYVVVDYKSDRVGPDVELGELVGREYGIQRLLYALAVLREGAAEVEIIHWFLERPEEPSSARYRSSERPALERELADRIERAGEDRFAVSPTPHRGLCLTCPGRLGLCSWGDAETLREDPVAVPGRSV
ncbi:MAG: family ATPase, partial [Solirubrobacterales bacterium]|nr:family ATPase [Solirubrobacterales bacterium]